MTVDLRVLREVKPSQWLLRFAVGGTFTLAAGLIARYFGPVVGGLFLAFPAIFPAGATLIESHQREKKRRAGIAQSTRGRCAAALDARGAAMGSTALVGFALIVWKLLPSHGAAPVLAAALAVWAALAILIWWVRRLPAVRQIFR